jgi:DNA invertase Pin-like site-specific DNA recombinase
MRAALYARTSTPSQHPDLQLEELRRLAEVRGWRIVAEQVDRGVSGAQARRTGLDALLRDAQRGSFEVVAVWKLDRLGRSLPHLLQVLGELDAWGVQLVSARDPGIDTTTPTGRLLTQLLGAFASFERELIQERIVAGVERARARGVVFGRPRAELTHDQVIRAIAEHGGVRPAARALGVSVGLVQRRQREMNMKAEQ